MTERELTILAYKDIDIVPITKMAIILGVKNPTTIKSRYPEAIIKRSGLYCVQKSLIGKIS